MTRHAITYWWTYGILFVYAFLFVFLFSCTTSPFYEHYPFWFHGDSGIFQEMGICLLQGGTPYVDLFDHKGPILWFIQALGIWISPQWGLMALQTVSLFCTLLVLYKASLLLVEKQLSSIIFSLLGLFFLLAFYERGNLCEEWSLPFISLPIYLYIKRWKESSKPINQAYNHIDALIIGLCVGIIAMIRLNNTAPIIGFVFWHFIRCLQHKEYKRLITDVVVICGGVIIILLLCSSYYLVKYGWSGVYEMYYGTFIFNFNYFKEVGPRYGFITKLQVYLLPSLFVVMIIINHFNNESFLDIYLPIILSYIVTIVTIGQLCYGHYLIIIVPLFVVSLYVLSNTKSPKKYLFYFLFGIIVVDCFRICLGPMDLLAYRLSKEPPNTERHDGFHRFITSLSDDEKHSIYNAGLNHMGAGLFADENIYQCNRFIYDGHLEMSTHLQEYEKTHGIKDLQPAWILTQSPRPEVCNEYMATNYILADSIPGGEYDPIWCWKKNLTDLTEP